MSGRQIKYIISGIRQHRLAAGIVGGVFVLIFAAIGIGVYKFIGGKKSASLPMLKLPRRMTLGRASDAAAQTDAPSAFSFQQRFVPVTTAFR